MWGGWTNAYANAGYPDGNNNGYPQMDFSVGNPGLQGWFAQPQPVGPREGAQLGTPMQVDTSDYGLYAKEKLAQEEQHDYAQDAYTSYGITPDQLDQLNEVCRVPPWRGRVPVHRAQLPSAWGWQGSYCVLLLN